MQELPEQAGLANWYWKGVRQFVWERFGTSLSRSSCLNWLHRLGFAFKRPKKRLLPSGSHSWRSTPPCGKAQRTEARIFFADEAHFRADAELRGKWVLKGEPALVSTSPPSYYSAVCLETGEVEWMELEGQLRDLGGLGPHAGPLNVIWDNAPAHRGEAVREYLRTLSWS